MTLHYNDDTLLYTRVSQMKTLNIFVVTYYNFYGFHLTLPHTIQHRPGI